MPATQDDRWWTFGTEEQRPGAATRWNRPAGAWRYRRLVRGSADQLVLVSVAVDDIRSDILAHANTRAGLSSGTHVKALATGRRKPIRLRSGPKMTAREIVRMVRKATTGRQYAVVSIGYPGPVLHGKPLSEAKNLGGGWVGFDFTKAFGCPVHVINDAAMQALGSYKGGRMLFLGLGTGLGSALIVDGVLEPMELAHLPYKNGRTYEDYVGKSALKRFGKKKWRRHVADVVTRLRAALEVDDVVIGGGNAKRLRTLPKDVRLGSNASAFIGGYRLWKRHA